MVAHNWGEMRVRKGEDIDKPGRGKCYTRFPYSCTPADSLEYVASVGARPIAVLHTYFFYLSQQLRKLRSSHKAWGEG